MTTSESVKGIIAALVVGALITLAGSQDSVEAFGLPLFAICALFAFVVQWIVFIPSYLFRTEHYYDFTGSLTYLSVVGLALFLGDSNDVRSQLIALLVGIWAVRLGSFLFTRVKKAGSDRRFTIMKTVPVWYFMTWTIQGLWVVVTLSAGLAAMTSNKQIDFGLFGYLGLAVWCLGFGMEALADRQKSQFRRDNKEGFITTGLWSWSRHPNYFGEITLWLGIAIIALPTLEGWRWVTMISPIFVFILLTRVSGVKMLERSAEKRWGENEAYQSYVSRTSVLMPRPPR